MNSTDTNQASEDELEHELDDIVHDALGEEFCNDCEHPRCLNKVKLYKRAIKALIRTEKLKLLDEVIHQSTVNLKSSKAVAGWAELRKKQLEAEL